MNAKASAATRPCGVSTHGSFPVSKKLLKLFSGVTSAAPANQAWNHIRWHRLSECPASNPVAVGPLVSSGPRVVTALPNQGLIWTDQGKFHCRAAPLEKANFDWVNPMFSPTSIPTTLAPHSAA